MQSAEQIFIEGFWEEHDLPVNESKLQSHDSFSHRPNSRNEVTFETKILDAVSTESNTMLEM